jgi:crossover junction endodeoxyribonuclease RuvC
MLKLGRAQGGSDCRCHGKKYPVTEYSPKKVKQSITGKVMPPKNSMADVTKNILPSPINQIFRCYGMH